MKKAIGIDIGGTNTIIGFVDESGRIEGKYHIRTEDYDDFDAFTAAISDKILKGMKAFKGFSVQEMFAGIGIGAPNGNYYRGTIEYAPNLKFKGVLPLAAHISSSTGIENVRLTNDANAAAIGEMIFGGARGMKDFIMITLGTGVGSGIVVNGILVLGHDGFAGEFGHTTLVPGGRECACGRKGCVETYCSARGIQRTVYELIANTITPSSLREVAFSSLTSRMIFNKAMEGDQLAMRAFEITGELLGRALADAVAYTSPSAIYLFGGLAAAGDILFGPVKKHMEMNLLPVFRNKVQILPSQLKEEEAAILGAASLVLMDNSA